MPMALIDYARPARLSNTTQNFLGIQIRHFGQNKMTKRQIKDFESALTSLKQDYPEVAEGISSIDLIHEHAAAQQSLTSRYFKGPGKELTFGVSIPNQTYGSQIGISMQNIHRANEGLELKAGAGVGITKSNPFASPANILNHEFGHAIHQFMTRTEPSNMSTGEYMERQGILMSKFKRQANQANLTPEAIGSRRAAADTEELWAESFARARSSEGPGLPQAKAFENSLGESMKIIRREKMASNSKNVYKMLRAVRSEMR